MIIFLNSWEKINHNDMKDSQQADILISIKSK